MITLITGSPGAGKTAALVSLLSELAGNRAVFCNGIPDLQVPHQELVDPTDWMAAVPDGSIIVIDEVQRVWRPMGPGQRVPDHIAALETHRHRGIDFYIVSQSPKLIHTNVRALVGRHVHLRDTGILGRYWYEWPECCDTCVAGWRGAPVRKKYKLPKKSFALYTSASEHIKPLRSVPRTLLVVVGAVLVLLVLTWRIYSSISAKLAPVAPVAPVASKVTAGPVLPAVSTVQAQPVSAGIDDRIAWIPRVSNRPESAPAFDGLRQVVAMPVVAAAVCNSSGCKCFTAQGSNAGLSSSECRAWLDNPPFNPYQSAQVVQASTAPPVAQAASDHPEHASK